ncbi:hypothetical protein QTP88_006286 [Uroleucon formosanum]
MKRVSIEREKARQLAAKARQLLRTESKENILGLVSVRQVRIGEIPTEEEKRQRNREKHLSIIQWVKDVNTVKQYHTTDWNELMDWRLVMEQSIHKYIPFEQSSVNLTRAVDYGGQKLEQYGRPKSTDNRINDDTLLWHLSRNALRSAIYRASIRRSRVVTNQHAVVTSLGH